MKKSNPTPAQPLSGEGAKGGTADFSTIDAKDNSVDFSIKAETKSNLIYPQTKVSNKEMPLAPPPAKGEAKPNCTTNKKSPQFSLPPIKK